MLASTEVLVDNGRDGRAVKIAVMGANGTLGRAVIERAIVRGHEIVAVTRGAPKRTFLRAVHRSADVLTGEGVMDALVGAEVVVNALDAKRGARALFGEGTARLLEMAERAAVSHYIGLSLVGADLVPMTYNAAKVAEEALVAGARIGWSLLRSTYFHDRIDAMFLESAHLGVLLAPPGMKLQPIDVREVAEAIVEAAEAGPRGRMPDLGGPEALFVRELARQWLRATKKTRLILPTPLTGQLGAALRAGHLCTPGRAVGKRSFAEWATERYSA